MWCETLRRFNRIGISSGEVFTFGRVGNCLPVFGTSDQGDLEGSRLLSEDDELNIACLKNMAYRQVFSLFVDVWIWPNA